MLGLRKGKIGNDKENTMAPEVLCDINIITTKESQI